MREVNKRQIDDAYDIDIVIPMYNSIEYSDVYLKRSRQYYRNEPVWDHNNNIDFPANNSNSILFKFKQQIIEQTGNGNTKDV